MLATTLKWDNYDSMHLFFMLNAGVHISNTNWQEKGFRKSDFHHRFHHNIFCSFSAHCNAVNVKFENKLQHCLKITLKSAYPL
ncbi:uncharacterized protein Smp_200790 [Schistosoma mansoni]|uniref:Smp_200790 n=1 Tax=Schistosoma mansoni TaxID=6183 RepID=G4V9S8_SCHMA|nr:uncharacterized protein Smp_200790 [Schistosoma mansoni]|eukprot:XP_018648207.1 uncharacterized protein Smp_200790 [Schistosoma mansoni]